MMNERTFDLEDRLVALTKEWRIMERKRFTLKQIRHFDKMLSCQPY